jgi:hypothetical protein
LLNSIPMHVEPYSVLLFLLSLSIGPNEEVKVPLISQPLILGILLLMNGCVCILGSSTLSSISRSTLFSWTRIKKPVSVGKIITMSWIIIYSQLYVYLQVNIIGIRFIGRLILIWRQVYSEWRLHEWITLCNFFWFTYLPLDSADK